MNSQKLKNLSVEDIHNIENVIGYTFKNKVLLEQAFTRSNYAREHIDVVSNEVLEFYGDRALDITVTKTFADVFGHIDNNGHYVTKRIAGTVEEANEGFLSAMRSCIVKKESLAKITEELGLEKYLINGESHSFADDKLSLSIKEDLLEAIFGAIAIDCNWDFSILEKTISKIIDLNQQIVNSNETNSRISDFAEWYFLHYGEFPNYEYAYDDMFHKYYCTFDIKTKDGETMTFDGTGSTRFEARNNALSNAYDELFVNGERYGAFPDDIDALVKKTWLNPSLERAINIVQEMEQQKLLHNVVYKYNENGNDENGNPLWSCTISYEFNDTASGSISCGGRNSKVLAKKHAALNLIKEVFEYYHIKD